MSAYRLTHLDDETLLSRLSTLIARDHASTAVLLAHIAEVDARRLYAARGFPSMFAYCVRELRLSEDSTGRRIQAARAARRFPRLFEEIAAGRIHLTAIGLLSPYLDAAPLDELIAAAAGKSKVELETWIADRFGSGSRWDSAHRARVTVVRAPAPGPAPAAADTVTPLEHALAVDSKDVVHSGPPIG